MIKEFVLNIPLINFIRYFSDDFFFFILKTFIYDENDNRK